MRVSISILLFILLLLGSSGETRFPETTQSIQENSPPLLDLVNGVITQSLNTHDPITITNDTELATVANSGNGTINNPYIITGWNISSSTSYGIYITGTTKYFIIENCWIKNSKYHGICVDSVSSGTATIINNTCNNNGGSGIYLWFTHSSTLTDNICNNNGDYGFSLSLSEFLTLTNNTGNGNFFHGIYLRSSGFSTVINNTSYSNGQDGLSLRYSSSLTVINNTGNNNSDIGLSFYSCESSTFIQNTGNYNTWHGIYLHSSGFSIVVNNTCTNNYFGITIENSGFLTLANNSFFNDGLNFMASSKEELLSFTVENNMVNELPLGYFENKTAIAIT
ncbi:MAG: right-handed parallel beta-helix repeat-containing protein, partial [Candidatus Hodarchaeales archaeon]